jgi:hypothetical protein
MPNHCENDLYIHGSKEDIDALLELMGTNKTPPEFDFNVVIPYPEKFKALDDELRALRDEVGWSEANKVFEERHGKGAQDGYNGGGCEWCREAWGTKWNAYDVVRRDYGAACITFQTAWGPPIPVIEALHVKFPALDLSLEYFEQGMCFCGGLNLSTPGEDAEEGDTGRDEWHLEGYRGHRGG